MYVAPEKQMKFDRWLESYTRSDRPNFACKVYVGAVFDKFLGEYVALYGQIFTTFAQFVYNIYTYIYISFVIPHV